jgi:hypothetical protein
MTIADTIKASLSTLKNVNGACTLDSIFEHINAGLLDNPILTRDQIRKAMNKVSNASKISSGVYRIKGRAKVHEMVVATGMYPRWIVMNKPRSK